VRPLDIELQQMCTGLQSAASSSISETLDLEIWRRLKGPHSAVQKYIFYHLIDELREFSGGT
jgi:hypothetical protein